MKNKIAFNLHQKITEMVGISHSSNLVLGELFYRILEKELYKDIVGDTNATFKHYLAQPEVKYSYSSAIRLVRIYKKYILELGLKYKSILGIGVNLLDRMTAVITKENAEDWLSKARELSKSDLNKLLKYGEVDEMKCKHNWIATPQKYYCDKCGAITSHIK